MKTLILSLICFISLQANQTPTYALVQDAAELEILSPTLAERQTAKLRLSNGLEAFLISDPGAQQSAAGIAVQAGSWNDPVEYPGMAHFLEHMLFLGTKNRFALRYLTGGRDGHVLGLRFGSALPRGILDLYARCIHKRRMGLLHSYVGLKSMLVSCGFESLQSFWAAPDMRYQERYVRTDVKSIREARKEGGFSQGQPKRDRLIKYLPSRLLKYFTPGLVFLARR